MRRSTSLIASLAVAAMAQALVAPVSAQTGSDASSTPSVAIPPAPATTLPPAAPPPPPLTPPQLLDKSLHDLAHGHLKEAGKDDIKALRRGPLLIHGNYCGVGNKPGTPPIDALDAACMRHDECTKTGTLPSCRCDRGLIDAAKTIAEDPSERPDLRALAATTVAAMSVLICTEKQPPVTAPAPPR